MKKIFTGICFAASASVPGSIFAATPTEQGAYAAAAADTISTDIGIRHGLHEKNPLGTGGAFAAKLVVLAVVSQMNEPKKTTAHHALTSAWTGAAVNNILATAGVAAAPLVGILAAVGLWKWLESTSPEEVAPAPLPAN